MKKLFAAMLALCCLWLTACMTKTPEPVEPSAPAQSVTVTNPDGTVDRTEYIYDENGKLTGRDHYQDGALTVSYVAYCDKAGRLVKLVDEKGSSGSSIEYTYDERGNTVKIETKLNDEVYYIQSYTYDENGKLETYTEEDLRVSNTAQYQYIYEEDGSFWEEYYENEELSSSWQYACNSAGKPVSGTLYDQDYLEIGTREYSYADGSETVVTYDKQGNETLRIETQLDADGRAVKQTLTADGQTTVTQYTYRESNNS